MATVPSIRRTPPPVPPETLPTPDRLWIRIPTSALTLEGFRDWATSIDFPEHVRAAFIGEEIYLDMSNEEPDAHVGVKTEVSRILSTLTRELKLGKFYADGVLVTNVAAKVSNNPDASLCGREALRAGRVRLVPRKNQPERYREIEGTPDWVLEVLSDSSEEKDTEKLREAYHRAGIPEYWLIDARGEELIFQVLNWRKTGYAATPVRDGWQRSRVFARSFRLDRQRDEFGLWEYTLHVRAD
jgi:Uma2 family endonuclease